MTDGVRRLSHDEAEMLISARMDEQLDRADSRALLVHLQSCESCRAFAVQSEVLGRELAALPVLPPSALVDRQIRQSIEKGRSRWSLASLMPATAGNSGLRVAVGALAMLTLVSVFLLVRMAGDQSGEGPSIDAPNGGVAQQLDRTPTDDSALLGETSAPTETARVVVPQTPESGSTEISGATEIVTSTEVPVATEAPSGTDVSENASIAQVAPTEVEIEPTATLDSSFVYQIEKTRTPVADPSETQEPAELEVTETTGDVSVAAVLVDDGTPVDSEATVTPVEQNTPDATEAPATPPNGDGISATELPIDDAGEEPAVEATLTPALPTEEPATEAPATSIPEPTATETPVQLAVDPTEPPAEPTTPPPAEGSSEVIQVESPEGSPQGASETPAAATVTPQLEVATEAAPEPIGQPTIAPISGQTSGDQGTGDVSSANATGESPQIVPSGENSNSEETDNGGSSGEPQSGDDNANGDDGNGGWGSDDPAGDGGVDDSGQTNSPQIVPSDGTNVPDGVGGATVQSEDSGEPAAVPTVDESAEPFGLDLSDTVTGLPPGTTSPVGRLEFSPGMNLYAVTAPDGQLAIANLDGDLVVTLGDSELPVWSGSGFMFSTAGDSGSIVGIWNSDSGELSYIPASADGASDDVPIGGDGSAFYYLRTYPESGIVELRSASIDGSDNGVLWTSDAVSLGGARPAWSVDGIYLPTESEWLFIDWDGNETSLGENPYGFVGAPVLSPGGGLMAYSAGDQVIVAWTTEPGAAVATAPFGGGGYAFATTGEEIVISDGSSLHVVSYDGADLGTLSGTQPIGACYWISDTIYYVQIGEDAALKSTNLSTIQAG